MKEHLVVVVAFDDVIIAPFINSKILIGKIARVGDVDQAFLALLDQKTNRIGRHRAKRLKKG
jgi:hypothetical protein